MIEEVGEDGEPLAPEDHVRKFVNQAGVIVRDNLQITIQEWNKLKAAGVSFVYDRTKDMLWDNLMANFTLPLEEDPEKKS